MSFSELGLNQSLCQLVAQKGYSEPTPIQQQAIPKVLAGHDVMAGAQTGTGKTAAFALPIIQKLVTQTTEGKKAIRALVLTPTRELAQQVCQSFTDYSAESEITATEAFGGVSINNQLKALAQGVDVLIATPGRLIDHLKRGSVELDQLEFLVFDEADRMLDMGFKDEIDEIRKYAARCQTLLFSATFDEAIFKLSKTLLNEPELIEANERNSAAVDVEQIAYECNKAQKREITAFLIGSKNWQQVLVFVRTKQGADALVKELKKDGLKAAAIHGDKAQGARDKALEDFKTGSVRVLVATDVASRGLDIAQLKVVINYELPHNPEDYVHRIGRTGRAGEKGLAITLLNPEDVWLLDQIHEVTETRLLQQWLPGFEPDLEQSFSPNSKPKKPQKTNVRKKRYRNNR